MRTRLAMDRTTPATMPFNVPSSTTPTQANKAQRNS